MRKEKEKKTAEKWLKVAPETAALKATLSQLPEVRLINRDISINDK